MKKIICLVLTFVLLLSSTVFATESFKDVEGSKYEEAVEMLVSFGIINGFDDNTFRPSESVTRAQLAKMLTLSMGVSEDEVKVAEKKFMNFSDVFSSHWGYGYIKIASDRGLVNGYPDGTFAPDATVTYAEAITMFLRMLDYEDALDKNLTWPNNYMVYADDKLDLFKGVNEFKASKPAPRGDIAILLWNTLRTGIAEIVAENNKGLVYGPGTPMITEYFNYIYIQNAEVLEIEFDDSYQTAKVTLKEKDKKSQKITVFAEDALEMFGKEVSILLDQKNNKIVESDYDTDYRVVKGEVTNITNSKIYLANRATGYNAPADENILLYQIEYFEDAVEVIMLVDGNTAKYCIARGASEAFPGYISNNNVEIADDAYGIRIRKPGVTKGGEDYYLANEDEWPDDDSIILYYINSEDFLVVLDEVKYKNASEVLSIGKDYIKVANSGTYEFEEDGYSVIFVNSSSIKNAELEDIESKKDSAVIKTYASHVFIFVYEDDIMDSLDEELVDLLYELEDIIEDALEYDEAKFTQKSYAILMEEVSYGQGLDYNSSKTRIENTIIDIEDAIAELDDEPSDNEKKIVSLKKELRAYINNECAKVIEDEFDYTDESYEYFDDMYDDALDVLEMYDADLDDVEDAYADLRDAVKKLEILE